MTKKLEVFKSDRKERNWSKVHNNVKRNGIKNQVTESFPCGKKLLILDLQENGQFILKIMGLFKNVCKVAKDSCWWFTIAAKKKKTKVWLACMWITLFIWCDSNTHCEKKLKCIYKRSSHNLNLCKIFFWPSESKHQFR